MKNFFTILLVMILTLGTVCVPCTAVSKAKISTQTESLRKEFSDELCETAVKENDGYLGVPVTFSVFRRKSVPSANFCLLYVIGHREERIGTDSDIDIINDFLDEGYIVTVIDYADNKNAVGTSLGYSIKEILADMRSGKYVGNNVFHSENIYVIPSGCRLVRDIYYFSLDTMAPYGVNEYILHTYNTYYAGIKKDNFGNLLPKATTLEECLNKDGNPIYLDLDMDIIYPANPKKEAPVFALASSSENRCAVVNRYNSNTVYFATALLTGYAGVVYNHEFMPMCRADHYNYDERFFTLSDYTANRSHSAAIRRIKYLASTYGYSKDYVAAFGFSKSGLGPAILADKTHEQRGEIKTLDEYCPEGKDVTQSPGEQPWLYYEGTNTPISSNVTTAYAGAGAGCCNYVEICINDNIVPLASSIGTVDTIGGFYTYLPRTKSVFNSVSAETLFIEAEGIDHNPAHLYNDTLGIDYLDAVWTFLDNHIKAASEKAAPEVLWATPRNDILYESLKENDISIKFSRAMDPKSVEENVKIIRLSDNKEVKGEWTTLHGNTTFYFNSPYIVNASSYRIEVSANTKAADGIAMSVPFIKTFTLDGSELLAVTNDTYVANDNANHSNENILKVDSNNTAYISFDRKIGFSDVTKAKLILNRTSDSNAIINLSTLENNFDQDTLNNDNLPDEKSNVGTFSVLNDVTAIDVTDYLKDANNNTLSFSIKADSKTGSVYSNDFNNANDSNFSAFNQFNWGNGDAVMNFSDNSYNGTNCIYVTGRTWQTRLKFLNSLGKRKLTEDDIGTVFKASFWIKSEESTSLLVGMFAESGAPGYVPYGEKNFDMKKDEWTFIEYVTVITKEMVDVNACAVTLVPYGSKPFYLDDLNVVYDNAPCEFVSSENNSGISCSLLLYTPEKYEISHSDYAVISNGENSNKVINEQPNTNGSPVADISGAQKGYIKIPISNIDLSGSVTLDFSISSLANNSLSIYGIADDDSRFAETFDGNICWNNAFANDINGYSVIKDKVYGKKALATLDTSESTQFSVDVKDYVSYMAEKGYKYVTFIFCANQQSTQTLVTFEGLDSYDNYTASYEMKGYDIGLTQDPQNPENRVFYFDKSGSENPSGYAQNVAFSGLIKSNDLFDESDIGSIYTVSFKQYIELEGYTTYSIFGNIGKPGSTNYSLPSYLSCKTIVNGNVATPPANDWFTVEYTINVTKETVSNYSNWTSIIVGSGWRATRIYVDDISVTKKSDSIKIPVDSNNTEISNTNFENIKEFNSFAPISFPTDCEIALKQDPKDKDNTAFYFEKSGVESTGYYQAVYLKNLIAKNGTFTDDDLGCTFTVRYKEYLVFTADDRNEYTVYDTISDQSFRDFIFSPSYVTKKFYYDGKEIDNAHIPTNDWFDVEMSFTVTADMIGTTSAPLGIMLASGWRASGIYVDDITVTSTISANEGTVPSLNFKGNKKVEYTTATVIYGNAPDSVHQTDYSIDITNGVLKNPGGLKKLYVNFDKSKILHTQKAFLNIEVTENSVGNTIYIYGIPKNIDLNGLTWNNAYANSDGMGMATSIVYGNSHIADITLSETKSVIDVTDFMKATDTLQGITFVICAKANEGITELTDLRLSIKGFPFYTSIEEPKLILPNKNDNFIAVQGINGMDVKVEDVTFYIDSNPVDKAFVKYGEVYYIYPDNLAEGEHEVYAKLTYNEKTVATTEILKYNFEKYNVLGDVDGNGIVNAADLAELKKQLAGFIEKTDVADVNGDNTLNVADLADLKKFLAGLIQL